MCAPDRYSIFPICWKLHGYSGRLCNTVWYLLLHSDSTYRGKIYGKRVDSFGIDFWRETHQHWGVGGFLVGMGNGGGIWTVLQMHLSPLWRECSANVPGEPFAVMPSTGSHEQAVSGRQAAAAAAMGLPILAKYFSFSSFVPLNSHLPSVFLLLLLSLLHCGRPPSRWTTHTCLSTSTASPLSLSWLTDVSMSADGQCGSRQPATQLSLALSILQ